MTGKHPNVTKSLGPHCKTTRCMSQGTRLLPDLGSQPHDWLKRWAGQTFLGKVVQATPLEEQERWLLDTRAKLSDQHFCSVFGESDGTRRHNYLDNKCTPDSAQTTISKGTTETVHAPSNIKAITKNHSNNVNIGSSSPISKQQQTNWMTSFTTANAGCKEEPTITNRNAHISTA